MKEINQELIGRVLEMYKPEQRLLKSANMNYPIISGKFLIGPTYYTHEPLKHATDIEIQLCLNQLVYVEVAESIQKNLVPELRGMDFSSLQKEGMLIIESQKRFNRDIKTDVEIDGVLRIRRLKNYKGLLVANTDFDFEKGSCFGFLELVIKKEFN